MGPVHIGVRHYDDLVIAQLALVKLLPQAGPQGGDHRLEEMSAAWYSVQQERDRQIIYVTYMAMVSAVQGGTYLI